MTSQAKNRVLAYIVISMMVITIYVGRHHDQTPTTATTVLLPKDKPVLVVVEEPKIDQAEFECLRTDLYHEAGNQSRRGMEAVALVPLTRVRTKHYPSTICGVVKEYAYNKHGRKVCQFSWYCDGKPDVPNLKNPLERAAWERATEVAMAGMQGKIKDFLGGATNYHADYVNPAFANAPKRYKFIAKIGSHLFYHDIALKLKA